MRRFTAWPSRRLTAAAIVGTIALGVGAATGVYAVFDGVVLRALPMPEPDRLVWMWNARVERDRDLGFVERSGRPEHVRRPVGVDKRCSGTESGSVPPSSAPSARNGTPQRTAPASGTSRAASLPRTISAAVRSVTSTCANVPRARSK